jgi:cell division transport system permease protein
MKIRTLKYIAKEGISNVYKNKLMSLASIGIVIASLVVFGIFLLFILNISFNTDILNQQPEMEVFCEYELAESEIDRIQQEIAGIGNIESSLKVTAKEHFDKFKESLGEDAGVLEGFDSSLMSASFVIKLKDPKQSSEAIEQFKGISGVRKVRYSKEVIEFISKLTSWINAISGFLIAVLIVVSVFIISNTIKLTVFARRREINIMKYIGATDWFIRWPFVVEGIVIGVIGAILAYLLTRYAYGTLETRFNSDLTSISKDFIRLVKAGDISIRLAGSYLSVGGGVGAIGSLISIRKYLRV